MHTKYSTFPIFSMSFFTTSAAAVFLFAFPPPHFYIPHIYTPTQRTQEVPNLANPATRLAEIHPGPDKEPDVMSLHTHLVKHPVSKLQELPKEV